MRGRSSEMSDFFPSEIHSHISLNSWKAGAIFRMNVQVYLIFAKIPLKSISFWQIWVERGHERARYTVLGDPNEAIAE